MTEAARPFRIRMTPRQARALSLVAIPALAVGYVGAAIAGDAAGAADLGLSALKLVGLVAAVTLFLSNYGQMTQDPEHALDEREVALRNRAHVLTHQATMGLLFLAFFYVEAAGKLGWWLPPAGSAGDMLVALALGAMVLPAAILAWRDRSLPDDDR